MTVKGRCGCGYIVQTQINQCEGHAETQGAEGGQLRRLRAASTVPVVREGLMVEEGGKRVCPGEVPRAALSWPHFTSLSSQASPSLTLLLEARLI